MKTYSLINMHDVAVLKQQYLTNKKMVQIETTPRPAASLLQNEVDTSQFSL
jgi:hypothetical protein